MERGQPKGSLLLNVLLVALLAVGGLIPGSAVAQSGTVVSIRSQKANSGAAVDVPIDVTEFEQVGSVSLVISYDPDVLSFPEGAETEDLISNAVRGDFMANVAEPGELRISWFDSSGSNPISLGDGTLLEITFSGFAGDTTEVTFEPESEISDAEADPIQTTFEGGTIGVNQAPTVGVNEGLTLEEGATSSITTGELSASDPDDGASALTFDVTDGPSNGAITVGSDTASTFTQADLEAGDVAYSHDGSETTEDSFTFDLTDPDGAGPTGQTFDITVEPVNEAPTVGINEGLTLEEGATSSITTGELSASDPDDEASALTFDVTDGPSNGAITVGGDTASTFTQADLEAGDVAYSHDGSETTEDSFTFDLSDSEGEGPTGTFDITINPVNDAPTISGLADADTTIDEDTSTDPIGFTIGDPETPPSDLALEDSTDNPDLIGSIEFGGSGADRTVTVTPAADSNGTAEITVTVKNGGEKTASQTFTLTVEPVDDAPVARVSIPDDTLKIPGPPLQLIDVVQAVFRDPEGDELTVSATSSNSSVVTTGVSGGETVTIAPEGEGTAEVTLTASDGAKEASVSFMATVEQRAAGEPEPQAAAVALVNTAGNGKTFDFGDTGMKIAPFGVEGAGGVRVALFDSAPDNAEGISEENVSQYRAVITASPELSFGSDTEVRFPVSDFGGIDDPTQVTIYRRPSPGSGSFSALSTTVDENGTPSDPSDDEIVGTSGSFSEFVLASDSEPLPVELISFTAQVDEATATLRWKTASETNNAGFEVEHQGPGHTGFSELGFVESKAASGTTTEVRSYRFRVDDLRAGEHQFRLKQKDLEGSVTVVGTVTVNVQMTEALTLTAPSPNPTSGATTLTFGVKKAADAEVAVYNVLGQQVKILYDGTPQEGQTTRLSFDASGLPSGTYFVRLRADGRDRTKRLTIIE